MRTILFFFFGALSISLLLTPLIRNVSESLNLVDLPGGRKIHNRAISRVGGIGIFLTFFVCVGSSYFIGSTITMELFDDSKAVFLLLGGLVIFTTGLIDDVKSLNANLKLFMQIVVGSIVYLGGMKISVVSLPIIGTVQFGILSYPVTILWFLVIINAVNLIDGLDGLAAGVGFLTFLILTVFGCLGQHYVVASLFAAMSGAVLGFLRYNFNPASIFMGDSGSYFIGYMIAGVSLYGSIKIHTTVTLSIAALSLSVPLSDTIVATFRRFLLGKKIFSPDKKHFHHQLLNRGLTQRNAVLLMYLATMMFSLMAIAMVYLNDHRSGVVFIAIVVSIIAGVGRLGYFSHVDFNNFIRWTSDIQDGIGLTQGRRQFLAHQVAIHDSQNIDEMRLQIEDALKMVDVNYFKLELGGHGCNFKQFEDYIWKKNGGDDVDRKIDRSLYITFPIEYEDRYFGRLTVTKKHFSSDFGTGVVLRRIELLRRTISRTLYDKKDITKYNLYDRRKNGGRDFLDEKVTKDDRRMV